MRKDITVYAKHLLFIITILIWLESFAQDNSQGYIDAAQITAYQAIGNEADVAFPGTRQALTVTYQRLQFQKASLFDARMPPEFVTRLAALRFRLINNSGTTDSLWFFPGLYFSPVALYRVSDGELHEIANVRPSLPDSVGYELITIAPHDSVSFIAALKILRTYTNALKPVLVEKSHLDSFIFSLSSRHFYMNMITYLFCGLFLMMILFSVGNYFLGGNREFLYYAGYALFLGGMLFTKTYYDYRVSPSAFFLEAYLDFILQCTGIGFYLVFMKKFLSARSTFPFLNVLYNTGFISVVIATALFSYLYFFTNNFIFLNEVENATKIGLLVLMVIFLVYCTNRWNHKLLRYLFWGNLLYFIFAVFSQLLILAGHLFNHYPAVFNSSLFYYELGLFLELVFFLAGLSYKNKTRIIEQTKERERLKMENTRKEFEKQIAVVTAQQEERNRISADMHDELGSGMTHIRLMSELAKNRMKESTPPEIEKISQSADDVLNKMNAIIWSMDSKNDSVGNLISYIRAYATEYLEGTPVQCVVHTPDRIPDKELAGDKRRSIFLCVKETLNNVLKHSHANQVTIEIMADEMLNIKIADNGVGIDLKNIRRFGNGLQNIDWRMKSIGGQFRIRNNHGTESVFTVAL